MGFTDNQEKAISLNGRNILVSAAAGSGKTSVLVERIIRKITDKVNPIDVDRFLVMTFTKAAAKEMKDRIRQAIEDRLVKGRDDNLIRQSVLVHNAQITTIDGFCQSIIRDHFGKTELDPNFRVADENECRLLMADVLDAVLEDYYNSSSDKFNNCVETVSYGKTDSEFEKLILSLYKFSQSSPNPKEFLENFIRPYCAADAEEFESSDFFKEYINVYTGKLRVCCEMLKEAEEIVDVTPQLAPIAINLENEFDLIKAAAEADNYEELSQKAVAINFATLKKTVIDKEDAALVAAKDKVTALRNAVKKNIGNIKDILSVTANEMYENMAGCRANVEVLIDVVNEFTSRYRAVKLDKNIIDFSDMEHIAIDILKNNEEIASLYREQFEEIYVDEYQDSNMTQETLVDCICRKDPGNLFMVGDVKQSIYRFRQARPDIFMSKYDRYSDEDSSEQRIILNDNFRSRSQVLDCVNEIFAAIMKKETGNIEYDQNASLKYGADYYEKADSEYEAEGHPKADKSLYEAQLLIGLGNDIDNKEFEALIIADRIRQLISDKTPVYDTEQKKLRPVRYSDIVILLRSFKGWDEIIKKTLTDAGIPVSISSTEGYFATDEIKTALSFLSVVDNPLQDIPLAAVMKSPVFDFNNRDLADIRAGHKDELLYFSLLRAAGRSLKMAETAYSSEDEAAFVAKSLKENEDTNAEPAEEPALKHLPDELTEKCNVFLDKLSYYREKAAYTPVYGILREFVDSEYGDYVRAMDRGFQRMTNLNMLMNKAEAYSRTSFKGLFNFVRYMDLIRKYEIEDGEASILGEEDDVVRVMTIHKSKGLEFPICFVAGIDKRRNVSDENGSVVWDATSGIGMDYINLDRRVKYPTLYKELVKNRLKTENVAEEMRILYVALTRAREKLIIVGHSKKDEDIMAFKKTDIISALTYLDMIATAWDRNGGLKHLKTTFIHPTDLVNDRMEQEIRGISKVEEALETYRNFDESTYKVPDMLHGLQSVYRGNDEEYPAKMSVSELKHMDIDEKERAGEDLAPEGVKMFSSTNPDTYIPKFMRGEEETATGGTFYGTAFHRILELWDYSKETVQAEDIKEYVLKMLEGHFMSRQQADAVRYADVAYFINSELGRSMYRAKQKGLLFREQPFGFGYKPGDDKSWKEEDDDFILVQGIIDAFYEEDDGIVIVDYKTDYVTKPEMLILRYRSQLEYYKIALTQITGKKVKAMVIYSSRLKQSIYL